MSAFDSCDAAPRYNRTVRALRSIKAYAGNVARDACESPANELAKRAVKAAFETGLPRDEQNALLEAELAIVDVVTATKEARDAYAQNAAKESEDASATYERFAKEETRPIRVALATLFSAASFVAGLYFHADSVAIVAFVCCVGVVLPELSAFFLDFYRKTE